MAELFNKAGYSILQIHGKVRQGARKFSTESFRNSKNVIMFSSDVSARGVDYPNVSLVIQVGYVDSQTYVHRLGRTGRAGRRGKGVVFLIDLEARRTLKE